jgi:hypothetical protein
MASSNQMLIDWLAGPVLSELITTAVIAPGLPKPLPAPFYQISDTEVVGVNVTWDATYGDRQMAQFTDPMSPSRRVESQVTQRPQAVAPASRTNFLVDTDMLNYIQASSLPFFRDRAVRIFKKKAADFKQRTQNLITNMPHAALGYGAIWADGNGNMLPSSTGAVQTVDFKLIYGPNAANVAGGVPLTKTSNWPNTTGANNIVGDWSNTSFDITGSLRGLEESFVFTSNYQAVHILYGKGIPSYLWDNTSIQSLISRNQVLGSQFWQGNQVPQGLAGFQWHPFYKAYFQDQNGVIHQFCADNQIIILPEVNPMWWEYFECSLPCPVGIPNAQIDWNEISTWAPNRKGYSSYSYGNMDPVSLTCVQQWAGLATVKSPLALYSATVS